MSISHITGTLQNNDGQTLFTQRWCIDGTPKASILLVHGMAEHSSRYGHVAQALNESGYNVYSYDHRGHGKSEGLRVHINRFEEYLEDLGLVLKQVQERGEGPVFLLAHSMGATICTVYTLRNQPDVAGMVLSAPALKPGDDITKFLIVVAKVLSRIIPKVPLQKLDNTSISRDPAVMKAYDEDPLNYRGGVRARIGAEMLRVMEEIKESRSQLSLPLYIFQGSGDKIIDPKASQEFFDAVGSSDKEFKLYDGLYHEAMNEPEQDEVIAGIVAWLDQRVGG